MSTPQSSNLPISRAISGFYRRWHMLEAGIGPDAGSILDFDYCPAELSDSATPYTTRIQALDTLIALRDELRSAEPTMFANYEFLSDKLLGSETYLRALMGEHFSFATYIRNILGVSTEPLTEVEIAELRDAAQTELAKFDIAWDASALEKYESRFAWDDVAQFALDLRQHAKYWVNKVRSELELTTEPNYTIEEAHEDAYWWNWIDGSVGQPIRLRVNTHPRIHLKKGSEISLAAHEIAGHAVHILELDASRRAGRVDAAAMNTTVHTLELFQMEGVAQSVLWLLVEDEATDILKAYSAVSMYHMALLQQAHIELEAGASITQTLRKIAAQSPLLKEETILSDLRDRCRHPMYRALMFVYYPSYKTFLCASHLSAAGKRMFLREMYREFWTPKQIFQQLERLASVA